MISFTGAFTYSRSRPPSRLSRMWRTFRSAFAAHRPSAHPLRSSPLSLPSLLASVLSFYSSQTAHPTAHGRETLPVSHVLRHLFPTTAQKETRPVHSRREAFVLSSAVRRSFQNEARSRQTRRHVHQTRQFSRRKLVGGRTTV